MVEIYYDTCSRYDGTPGWMLSDPDGDINLDGTNEADAIREAAEIVGVLEAEVTVGETV